MTITYKQLLSEMPLHVANAELQRHIRVTGNVKSAVERMRKQHGKTFIPHPTEPKIVRVIEGADVDEGIKGAVAGALLGAAVASGHVPTPPESVWATTPPKEFKEVTVTTPAKYDWKEPKKTKYVVLPKDHTPPSQEPNHQVDIKGVTHNVWKKYGTNYAQEVSTNK